MLRHFQVQRPSCTESAQELSKDLVWNNAYKSEGVRTQETGSHGAHRAEDAHSARVAEATETESTRCPPTTTQADLMTLALFQDKLRKFGHSLNFRGATFGP